MSKTEQTHRQKLRNDAIFECQLKILNGMCSLQITGFDLIRKISCNRIILLCTLDRWVNGMFEVTFIDKCVILWIITLLLLLLG